MQRFLLLAVLLVGAPLAGCGGEAREAEVPSGPPGPTAADEIGTPGVIDLVAELRGAVVGVPTTLIRLGSEESHKHYRGGWSEDGRAAEKSLVWATGDTSRLVVGLASSQALTMSFRARPLVYEGAPEQSVTVSINGTDVGRVVLTPRRAPGGKLRQYSVEVPEGVGHPGENWIEFHHAWSRRPADVTPNGTDTRELASVWSEVRFEGSPQVDGPSVFKHGDVGSLVLPVGTQLQYFASLGEGAVFKLDALLEGQDGTANSLQVLVETDGDGVVLDELVPANGHSLALAIGPHKDSKARVTLRSVPNNEQYSGAGVLELKGPRLLVGERAKAARQYLGLPEVRAKRPNVLIYLIDTLRADHMSAYGYDKPTTPNIEEFAKTAVFFEKAHAASAWTRASTASLLTGMYARHHGAEDRTEILGDTIQTLAELLEAAGYRTGMFFTNANVGADFGFAQGFEHREYFGEDLETTAVYASAIQTQAAALEWINAGDDQPWFAYIHVTDPHGPYAPAPQFAEAFTDGDYPDEMTTLDYMYDLDKSGRTLEQAPLSDIISLYDAEIAQVDHAFGELLTSLKGRSDFDETIIALTADHGEEFLDHGWWQHGKTVFGEQLNVPLVLRFPEDWSAGVRVAGDAQLIDLFPTLAEWLELPVSEQVDGISMLTPGEEPGPLTLGPDAIAASIHLDSRISRAVIQDGWKLIDVISLEHPGSIYFHAAMPTPYNQRFPYTPYALLFNVAEDPSEQKNLALEHPILVAYLRALIRRVPIAENKVSEELDPELDAKLRALGY